MGLLLFFHKVGWILAEFGVANLLLLAVLRMRLRKQPGAKSKVIYGLAGGMLLSMATVGFVMVFLSSPTIAPIRQP